MGAARNYHVKLLFDDSNAMKNVKDLGINIKDVFVYVHARKVRWATCPEIQLAVIGQNEAKVQKLIKGKQKTLKLSKRIYQDIQKGQIAGPVILGCCSYSRDARVLFLNDPGGRTLEAKDLTKQSLIVQERDHHLDPAQCQIKILEIDPNRTDLENECPKGDPNNL